jgi:hypothetical protein
MYWACVSFVFEHVLDDLKLKMLRNMCSPPAPSMLFFECRAQNKISTLSSPRESFVYKYLQCLPATRENHSPFFIFLFVPLGLTFRKKRLLVSWAVVYLTDGQVWLHCVYCVSLVSAVCERILPYMVNANLICISCYYWDWTFPTFMDMHSYCSVACAVFCLF